MAARQQSKPPGSQPGKVAGANRRKKVKEMDNNKKPSEPLEPERWTLKNASTEQLVTELSSREGVASYRVEPYQFKTVTAEGPALVFIVTD